MTVYSDNPAGRLHNLITRYTNNSSGSRPHLAWFAVLGIPEQDSPRLLRRLAAILEMPAEIEAEIGRVNPDEFDLDSVMRWQPDILAMLADSVFSTVPPQQLPGHSSKQVTQRASIATLFSLEQCSFVLHRHRPQRVISDTDVQHIKSLLEELTTAINEDLKAEPDLCEFLLRHARNMADALDDLWIRGSAALEDAYDQAVGAAARKAGEVAERGYTRREAWKKFGHVLVTVTAILQVPNTALQLPAEVRGVIEGSSQPSTENLNINEKIVVEPEQESGAQAANEPEHNRQKAHANGSKAP